MRYLQVESLRPRSLPLCFKEWEALGEGDEDRRLFSVPSLMV